LDNQIMTKKSDLNLPLTRNRYLDYSEDDGIENVNFLRFFLNNLFLLK